MKKVLSLVCVLLLCAALIPAAVAEEAAYTETVVSIPNGDHDIPATVCVPNGEGKFPAVVMLHGSNVCGTLMPAEEMGAFCRRHGLVFILDTAQTAGTFPIDMEAMHIDALAFTGHKGLLGPQGIGGFLLRPELVGRLDELIVFRPLADESLCAIAEKLLGQLEERAAHNGYQLTHTPRVGPALAARARSPYGARELRRQVDRAVEQAFADQIASGSVSLGQHWTADCAEDGTIVVQETQTAGVG